MINYPSSMLSLVSAGECTWVRQHSLVSAPNCQITNCDTPSHSHTAATYPKSEEITHKPKTVGPVGLLLPPMLFSLPCYFPSPAIPTSPSSSKSMSSIIDFLWFSVSRQKVWATDTAPADHFWSALAWSKTKCHTSQENIFRTWAMGPKDSNFPKVCAWTHTHRRT